MLGVLKFAARAAIWRTTSDPPLVALPVLLGFAMVAYPTSLIFAVAHAMERTLADLRDGRLASVEQTLSFEQFKDITGLAHWGEIEQRFDATP